MAVAGGSPPRAYPSLFKRSPAAAHRKSGGALELGSAPGGAAVVIANARSRCKAASFSLCEWWCHVRIRNTDDGWIAAPSTG